MKQTTNNEGEILRLIDKMQVQLFAIDQKLNNIMNRLNPDGKPLPSMPVLSAPAAPKPQHQSNPKIMYQIICADCKKTSELPFKPSGDRPVYCKECFSKRRSGHAPKTAVVESLKEVPVQNKVIKAEAPIETKPKKAAKKKAVVKKPAVKKKVTPKKK